MFLLELKLEKKLLSSDLLNQYPLLYNEISVRHVVDFYHKGITQ